MEAEEAFKLLLRKEIFCANLSRTLKVSSACCKNGCDIFKYRYFSGAVLRGTRKLLEKRLQDRAPVF